MIKIQQSQGLNFTFYKFWSIVQVLSIQYFTYAGQLLRAVTALEFFDFVVNSIHMLVPQAGNAKCFLTKLAFVVFGHFHPLMDMFLVPDQFIVLDKGFGTLVTPEKIIHEK